MKDLTPRQREIFDYIKKSVIKMGRPPSLREIGEKFGINSTNGVRSALEALERKGFIRRNRYQSRGIDILKEAPEHLDDSQLQAVPIIGRVAAGMPLWAEQNIEGNFYVDRTFVTGEHIFALRVQGDSMKDAGIFDGDFVLVRLWRKSRMRPQSNGSIPNANESASNPKTPISARSLSRKALPDSPSPARLWGCCGRCKRGRG